MGGKKKGRRQSDPSREEAESTDEENITEVDNSVCPHTGKAVALTAIKKNLKISFVKIGQCAPCLKAKKLQGRPAPPPRPGGKKTLQEQKREQLERARQEQIAAAAKLKALKQASQPAVAIATPSQPQPPESTDDKEKKVEASKPAVQVPAVVWLCLRCGSQCCGKETKNHCEEHFKTPRSELHCLYLNTDTWQIYCWECNKDIYVDSHKKLYEAVEFVKKVNEKPNKQNVKTLSRLTGKEARDQAGGTGTAAQAGQLPKVKGLTNLGNTCFFNSVMQCLSQTHPLTQLIDQQTSKGANLNLNVLDENECTLSEDENDNILDSTFLPVPELSLQLPEGGPMMTSLAAFLKDMHAVNKAVTINPSHLFGQVVKQSPKFRGMQQQDSQELLRYLMDGLRNEEAKRQKSAILKYFGLTEKTDPKTVSKATKKKIKLYGRTGNHTLLDKVFSGQMVSTIVCEECHYSSQLYEPFLDLSLPVVEDKPSHKPRGRLGPAVLPDDEDNVRVTCCGVQEEKRSKGQIKKDKLRKKKESRKNRKNGSNGVIEEEKEEDLADTSVINKKDDEKGFTSSQSAPGTLNSLVAATLTALVPTTANSTTTSITAKTTTSTTSSSAGTTTSSGVSSASTSEKAGGKAGMNGTSERGGGDSKTTPSKSKSAYEMSVNDSKNKSSKGNSSWKDGYDEDEEEEEEGYEEGDEDGWEWEYGETWEEGGEGEEELDEEENGEEEEGDDKSTYAANADDTPSEPLQSLNPLPPEMINHNFEHEQSAERTTGTEEAETGASSNADVEDNDSDDKHFGSTANSSGKSEKHWTAGSRRSLLINMPQLAPLQLDSMNLDPRMEAICKGIKLLTTKDGGGEEEHEGKWRKEGEMEVEGEEHEDNMARLRNEWTARTLVSLAPRYEMSTGECSVYSCLNQFTQSELLTGSNKWACDNCTSLRKKEDSEDDKKIYTNASKQFLIFYPPMVLTLHLKRFQQTLVGCRKLNKHVVFPLVLDLAPFCSSTCLALPHMKLNQNKVMYSLYGVVEHSGRLQGGHYTAYVKVRPANLTTRDISTFFSPALSRTSDIPRFLRDLQKKFQDWTDLEAKSGEDTDTGNIPRKWFHVSDTNVSEVSEDKVLKAQAYLLFYERIL